MTNRPTLMRFYQIYLCWFYNLEDVTEKLQGANLNVGLKWHLLYGGSMMTIDDLSVTRLLSALCPVCSLHVHSHCGQHIRCPHLVALQVEGN